MSAKRVSNTEKGLLLNKDLIRYLRPFFRIWDPFHSTFETLLVLWDPFQHLTPFWPTFETLFVIWDPFQHLTPFSFNILDLIRYLRPFSAFETLFIQHLRPYWLFETLFIIWWAHFQKGLNSLLVEIELLVEYSRVSKTTHFDSNFMSLAYLVPTLWAL